MSGFLDEKVNAQPSIAGKCQLLMRAAQDVLESRDSFAEFHSYLPTLMTHLFGFHDRR
jgi:hypothetical protein